MCQFYSVILRNTSSDESLRLTRLEMSQICQTPGRPLWLHFGMFTANGGTGYVLKPDVMLPPEGTPLEAVFDPLDVPPPSKVLTVRAEQNEVSAAILSPTEAEERKYIPDSGPCRLVIFETMVESNFGSARMILRGCHAEISSPGTNWIHEMTLVGITDMLIYLLKSGFTRPLSFQVCFQIR